LLSGERLLVLKAINSKQCALKLVIKVLMLNFLFKRNTPMKKQILSFALVATIIGSVAVGCSSSEKATSVSDSTTVDSTVVVPDTAKKDTIVVDTTKKM
jgi:hypothetical protein